MGWKVEGEREGGGLEVGLERREEVVGMWVRGREGLGRLGGVGGVVGRLERGVKAVEAVEGG